MGQMISILKDGEPPRKGDIFGMTLTKTACRSYSGYLCCTECRKPIEIHEDDKLRCSACGDEYGHMSFDEFMKTKN